MKKFTINCDFGGQMSPFTIFIGEPESEHHPLHFQADWLSKERNGTIPSQVMDAIAKLKELADKNKVSLEELCVYALGSVGADETQAIEAEGGEQVDVEQEVVAPDVYGQQGASVENTQTQEGMDTSTSEELVNQDAADTGVGDDSPSQEALNTSAHEESSGQEAVDRVVSQELPSQEATDNVEQINDVAGDQATDNILMEEDVNDSTPSEQSIDTDQQKQEVGDNISVQESNLDNQVVNQPIEQNIEEQVATTDNNMIPEQQDLVQNKDEKPVDAINDQQVVSSDSENKQ